MIARIGGSSSGFEFASAIWPGKAVSASAPAAVYCINSRRVSLILSIEDNFNAFRPEFKDELLFGYFWVWPDFLASDFLFILAFRRLALIGFVFLGRKVVYFHNPL